MQYNAALDNTASAASNVVVIRPAAAFRHPGAAQAGRLRSGGPVLLCSFAVGFPRHRAWRGGRFEVRRRIAFARAATCRAHERIVPEAYRGGL